MNATQPATSRSRIEPGQSVVLINGSGSKTSAVYQGVDCANSTKPQAVYHVTIGRFGKARISTPLGEQVIAGETVTHQTATYNYAIFDGRGWGAVWPNGEQLEPKVMRDTQR